MIITDQTTIESIMNHLSGFKLRKGIVDRLISIIDPSDTLRDQYLGATSYETRERR
ncbi:hypothetical protein [Paenibacillus lutimineralis]|uniref:hypothetical protein n=1 Tax=Paenibacillus lutimineralis TaxID=2707005 RepID=UPI0013A65900|nr:hypothetical protein [Paenibacillus lutimineralis]